MDTEPQPQIFVCAVCSESVEAAMSAECNWCDGRYHLNPRNDIDAKDCGEVWIDEQYLALQFACYNCLAAERGESGAPAALPRPRPAAKRPRRYKRRA